jgi:hypothetical protein
MNESVEQDPSIMEMAEQIDEDPAFTQMAEQLQKTAASPRQAALDPQKYVATKQQLMQNPQFVVMAERLGSTLMHDPAMAVVLGGLTNPAHKEQLEARIAHVKEDPTLKPQERRLHRMQQELPRRLLPPWRRRSAARGAAWLCWCRAWKARRTWPEVRTRRRRCCSLQRLKIWGGEGEAEVARWDLQVGKENRETVGAKCVLGIKIFLLHPQ